MTTEYNLPTDWERLVPQNRKGHWVISDAGCESLPYKNKNDKWAIVLWNRREECHYEFEFESGDMRWSRHPWDNSGLYYSHKNDIVDLVERLPNSPK
jgi:hypothetical protein